MAKNAKPVFLIGTNQVFPSIDAAAKALKVSPSGISKVVSGKIPSIKGHRLGLLSERVIRIPETGQTFSNPVTAARKLNVKAKRISKLLETGEVGTAGGYHFMYDIANTTNNLSISNPTKSKRNAKKSRKSNKKQQIKARQQKKKNKLERATKKAAERAIDKQIAAEKRREKEIAKQERIKHAEVIRRTSDLRALLDRVNNQLTKYAGRGMLEYSIPAQEIMSFMTYLNEDDDLDLFDTSSVNMAYIAENMTDFEISHWMEQIAKEMQRNNNLFFDIDKQEKERNTYAQEFGISLAQLDEYAEFIPDLWLIFKAGRLEFDYPTIIWDELKIAVAGGIPKEEFKKVMDMLKMYFHHNAKEELLNRILDTLRSYTPEPEITDDIPF